MQAHSTNRNRSSIWGPLGLVIIVVALIVGVGVVSHTNHSSVKKEQYGNITVIHNAEEADGGIPIHHATEINLYQPLPTGESTDRFLTDELSKLHYDGPLFYLVVDDKIASIATEQLTHQQLMDFSEALKHR